MTYSPAASVPTCSPDVDILHHIGLIARNLDALAHRYEALGFTVTPVSYPLIPLRAGQEPQPVGVGNRCVIFRNNYLEFLGVVDPERWASVSLAERGPFDIDRPLRRYEGLHVLHLGADDLDVVSRRLAASGIDHQPIRPFQRLVDTPAGLRMMRARTLSLRPGAMPEALFQIIQHETPELVLQPRHMDHANGAHGLVDVIVCVEDSNEVAARYAAAAGKNVQVDGRVRRIGLGRSDVLVTDTLGLRDILPGIEPPTLPWLAGFTVAANLARSTAFLVRRGIACVHVDGHLVVAPDRAHGAAIRFRHEARA